MLFNNTTLSCRTTDSGRTQVLQARIVGILLLGMFFFMVPRHKQSTAQCAVGDPHRTLRADPLKGFL